MSRGADPSQQAESWRTLPTPLAQAINMGHASTVATLIMYGANIHDSIDNSKNYLTYAIECEKYDIAEMLMACGLTVESSTLENIADPETRDYFSHPLSPERVLFLDTWFDNFWLCLTEWGQVDVLEFNLKAQIAHARNTYSRMDYARTMK